jgi:hypothetical protein
MGKLPKKRDVHLRVEPELADMIKERAERGSRTVPAEIVRAIRIAYKLGIKEELAT